jgi:hypothetical protein
LVDDAADAICKKQQQDPKPKPKPQGGALGGNMWERPPGWGLGGGWGGAPGGNMWERPPGWGLGGGWGGPPVPPGPGL